MPGRNRNNLKAFEKKSITITEINGIKFELGTPSPEIVQKFLSSEDGSDNAEKLDLIIELVAECMDEDISDPEGRALVYKAFFASGGPDGELAQACLAKCGIDVRKIDDTEGEASLVTDIPTS